LNNFFEWIAESKPRTDAFELYASLALILVALLWFGGELLGAVLTRMPA